MGKNSQRRHLRPMNRAARRGVLDIGGITSSPAFLDARDGQMAEIRQAPSITTGGSAPLGSTVVVICDHAFVSGGLAKVAITSACALRRRGHRVIFFSAVGPVTPLLAEHGVEVICLDQPDMLGDSSQLRAAARAIWNKKAVARLSEILSTLRRDRTIVHVHGWSKALSPSVLHVVRNSEFPSVETLHDYVRHCPNGAFFDFVAQENCDRKPMSYDCITRNCDARNYGHKLWRVMRHSVLSQVAGELATSHCIVISEHQDEIIRRHIPDSNRIHFVPNLVDAEDRGPAPVRDNDAFLFIGRLSEEKGADLLADARAMVDVPLVFVGDGPAMGKIAGRGKATFTGWLDKPALMRQLRNARALVFPSRWYETFGLTVAEALANGVPVIVSDNTAAASLVKPDRTGLRFKNGDVNDLARCLEALRGRDYAARLGAAAHQDYWRAPLTAERHVERLEQVYDVILGSAVFQPPLIAKAI